MSLLGGPETYPLTSIPVCIVAAACSMDLRWQAHLQTGVISPLLGNQVVLCSLAASKLLKKLLQIRRSLDSGTSAMGRTMDEGVSVVMDANETLCVGLGDISCVDGALDGTFMHLDGRSRLDMPSPEVIRDEAMSERLWAAQQWRTVAKTLAGEIMAASSGQASFDGTFSSMFDSYAAKTTGTPFNPLKDNDAVVVVTMDRALKRAILTEMLRSLCLLCRIDSHVSSQVRLMAQSVH